MDKIIPVVVVYEVSEIRTILSNLKANNIFCAEITFRTDCAARAIAEGVRLFSDMNIGAGTVINTEQCNQAIEAGAKFIVSPGFSKEVAQVCRDNAIAYYPGCVTPTEIMQALNEGFNVVKFFPADVYGGLKAMKTLSAPFPQVRFIPTGGVNWDNVEEYLAWDKIYAVGGSAFIEKRKSMRNEGTKS